MNMVVKLQDIKSTHRNLLHSYTLTMRKQKEKWRKQFHSPLQRKVKYLGIYLPKETKDLLLQVWELSSQSHQIYFWSPSLSFPSVTPIIWMFVCLMLSQRSQTVLILKNFFFFVLFQLGDFHYSIFQIIYAFFWTP